MDICLHYSNNVFKERCICDQCDTFISYIPYITINFRMDGSAFCDRNDKPLPFYRFLFIPGSTAHKFAHKQKAHVLLCKVGQRLLCVLQCH